MREADLKGGRPARIRKLVLAAAVSALGLAGGAAPVGALTLPLPTPLPTVSVPQILPTPPVPLPSTTPLPSLPPVLGGTHSSPSPGGGGGGTGGNPGGGQTGSSSSGGSGGSTAQGGGGSSTGPAGSGGAHHATARAPATTVLGPLPAFPGLPRGAAQQVAWGILLALPLLLLVWVIVLFRIALRLRHLRGSAALLSAASELGLTPREIAGLTPSALERLRDQLAVDDLTGCMRRASGLAALERELARARREKTPVTIGFIDADGLKHANDTLGHAAGDQLLKDVAGGLRSRLRGTDFVFRYGGDEFVCVLPGAHGAEAAAALIDVQAQLRLQGRSFSLGMAEFTTTDTAVTLLGRADEALYEAKRQLRVGRDVVPAPKPVAVPGSSSQISA